MSATTNLRFANNNFIDATATITSSTFNTSYPMSRIYDPRRSVYGLFRGNFLVDTSNQEIYINDGSNKTVTLTTGEYTGTTLAAHVQTQLNASSSNWTCTYSTTTYKFTISRSSGTKVLRFTVTTNAAWDMLGFTTAVDTSATVVSDEARIHTHEYLILDLGTSQTIGFAGVIGLITEEFGFSSSAVFKIQGNNTNTWSSPSTDVTMTRGVSGAFGFPDASHRYWRLYIQDRQNANGPTALKLGYVSISTAITFASSSIMNGFGVRYADNSVSLSSENGTKYFDTRTKFWTFSGRIGFTYGSERRELQQFFFDSGIVSPFFICLDPTLAVFAYHADCTKFVRFTDPPSLSHIVRDYFTADISIEECL